MKRSRRLLFLGSIVALIGIGLVIFFQMKGKFEYAKIDYDGVTIDCKYIKFTEPLKVSVISGFDIPEDILDHVPQWVKYYQYKTYGSVAGRSFNPEFFPEVDIDTKERYEKEWADKNRIYDTAIKRVESWPKKDHHEFMDGLLFIKIDDMEYILFDKYKESSSLRSTALFIEGHVNHADNQIYDISGKSDILFKIPVKDKSLLIEKLKHHKKGLLEYSGNVSQLDISKFR